MLLECFKDLHYLIDVKPHYLRRGKLKSGALSQGLFDEMKKFVVDFCGRVDNLNDKKNIINELDEYSKRFIDIKDKIRKEIPDKKGNMLFIPAEYVEVIYIVSYYMSNKLEVTQEEAASILGITQKEYRDRFGISPSVDCKAYKTKYAFRLPIDDREELLDVIIPLIGKTSAEISNSYFISLSNDLSIVANVENNNKALKNSIQMFYNIKDNDDIYKWVFYESLKDNVSSIKEKISAIIDTTNKEMTEDIFVESLKWGIDIKQENLKESNMERFNSKYSDFRACVEKRDWYLTARDDETYDDADIFNVEVTPLMLQGLKTDKLSVEDIRKKAPNRVEYCNECIAELSKSILEYIQYFVTSIDFSTLGVSAPAFIQYIMNRYENELFENPSQDIFLNAESYCMKYFIYNYFNKNGVSQDSYDKLIKYIETSDLREYVIRYINVNCQAFSNGEEVISKTSIWGKFDELIEGLHSSKEARCIRTALVYINLDDFPFSSEELLKLMTLDENIYYIISSSERLNISLSEIEEIIDNKKYYIYIKEGQ